MKSVVLNEQNSNSRKIGTSEKRGIELITSDGNSAKPLDLLKEVLYQVMLFVSVPIHSPWLRNIVLWWDRIISLVFCNKSSDRIGSISRNQLI